MKAQVLHTPSPIEDAPLEPADISVPEPGSSEVRLEVKVCGVCHTDLHTVEGDLDLPERRIVPGHQIVGLVNQTGDEADRFDTGQRVGVGWLGRTCGSCTYCAEGRENLCPRAKFTGLDIDGGYAEYAVVDEQFAYALPAAFSNVQAAPLLCAGIIGYRSLRRSEIQPGGRLGLYGFGSSAHLVIQVARYWDCEVYVFSRTPAHRRLAEELGAVWTGSATEHPPESLDAGVTFAPVGWIVVKALRHLRPGGTLAVNAIHMSPIPEMPYPVIYDERTLRSVKNFTRADATEFLSLAADIPIETTVETFPLSDVNDVLHRLKNSEIDGSAALVVDDT